MGLGRFIRRIKKIRPPPRAALRGALGLLLKKLFFFVSLIEKEGLHCLATISGGKYRLRPGRKGPRAAFFAPQLDLENAAEKFFWAPRLWNPRWRGPPAARYFYFPLLGGQDPFSFSFLVN